MNSKKYIENYLKETREFTKLISIDAIDKAVKLLFTAWKNGSHVYTCGNGGSASTATHFACDLVKTTAVAGKRGIKAECLNDNIPLVLALINDDGFDNLFSEQLKTKAQEGDILICISVHGSSGRDRAGLWSQNLLRAMSYIQDIGGKTIGLSGFDGGAIKEIADVSIVVPADSTPHVESLHLVIEHLVCSCLREKIAMA
jgi:D-sedoheptulose 7-phosphate isomerase